MPPRSVLYAWLLCSLWNEISEACLNEGSFSKYYVHLKHVQQMPAQKAEISRRWYLHLATVKRSKGNKILPMSFCSQRDLRFRMIKGNLSAGNANGPLSERQCHLWLYFLLQYTAQDDPMQMHILEFVGRKIEWLLGKLAVPSRFLSQVICTLTMSSPEEVKSFQIRKSQKSNNTEYEISDIGHSIPILRIFFLL